MINIYVINNCLLVIRDVHHSNYLFSSYLNTNYLLIIDAHLEVLLEIHPSHIIIIKDITK